MKCGHTFEVYYIYLIKICYYITVTNLSLQDDCNWKMRIELLVVSLVICL